MTRMLGHPGYPMGIRQAASRFGRVAACGLLAALVTLANVSGADYPIRLVQDPAVSPDGQQVAFSWRGDLWIAPITGGAARQLTTHPATDRDPEFSPDGKRIAFVSNRTGTYQVFVMPLAGGPPTRLTWHSEGYRLMEWYPDGKSLLVRGARDHFWRHAERFFRITTEPRTGEKLLFDAYGSDGHLSPDAGRILFAREGTRSWRKGYTGSQASQIWMYDVAKKQFTEVVRHPRGCRYPLWDPDGRHLYYVSGRSGAFNLWHRDLSTGKERVLTHFKDDSVMFPAIARNGSTIVFRHLFDLYRIDLKSNQVARIDLRYTGDAPRPPRFDRKLTTATEAVFSRDGLEIAFIAGGDVWVMDTELREPKQVTSTTEEERDLEMSPDGRTLFFVSDRDGQSDIWRATRTDESSYWWQNDTFTLQRLTNDPTVEFNVDVSPDGKHLAYCRERGDLWLMSVDGKKARRLAASWNAPDYNWSPDGRWIVFAKDDDDFNRDVFIVPVDGSRKPFNVSRHPDNDSAPVWSPDGRMIAFRGRRLGEESDIYYVFLRAADEEQTARDRKLKKAIDKMKKLRRSASPPRSTAAANKAHQGNKGVKQRTATTASAGKPATPGLPKVVIDFDGLEDRVHRIPIPQATERGLFWSGDSKRLFFSATIHGKSGTYSVSPPESHTPRLLTTQTGTGPVWIAKTNQIAWLSRGVPTAVSSTSGSATRYTFQAEQSVDVEERFRTAFMQCWRVMRDRYYDGTLNHRNWDAIRRKYEPMAAAAEDERMLGQVVNLMLGELNGSHLGFFVTSRRAAGPNGEAMETTAHLGVRFDPLHRGPGLKIRDVIHGSPAANQKSRLRTGEIILSIDGKEVDPDLDLTLRLNGSLSRDIRLQVRGVDGKERQVVLRPISYAKARSLLYDHWVRQNRAAVDKASKGTLAYVHIRGMDMSSFYQFEQDLFKVASGKEGIIIDVRENGGGFTTDHLLTILTQPTHAITVPRGGNPGYPQDRMVYATWRKPVTVLCNQNSFSNAEIFSHAIKTLKRGRVVGAPTAGGVISTGGTMILDVGFLRVPFRGWFLADSGEDMELHGCQPDVVVWPKPGELPRGVDRQLGKGIEVLREDVARWKKRPRPKLRKASDRRGP